MVDCVESTWLQLQHGGSCALCCYCCCCCCCLVWCKCQWDQCLLVIYFFGAEILNFIYIFIFSQHVDFGLLWLEIILPIKWEIVNVCVYWAEFKCYFAYNRRHWALFIYILAYASNFGWLKYKLKLKSIAYNSSTQSTWTGYCSAHAGWLHRNPKIKCAFRFFSFVFLFFFFFIVFCCHSLYFVRTMTERIHSKFIWSMLMPLMYIIILVKTNIFMWNVFALWKFHKCGSSTNFYCK